MDIMDKVFDKTRAENEATRIEILGELEARQVHITADLKKAGTLINQIDQAISVLEFDFATEEVCQVIVDMYVKIKSALNDAEIAGAAV